MNKEKNLEDLNPMECMSYTYNLKEQYYGDELINKLIEDCETEENIFSMWELAQIYRDTDRVEEYVYYLKKIYTASYRFITELRIERTDPYMVDVRVLHDAYIWSNVFFCSCDELAQYYLSVGDDESYKKAISIYENLECNYFDSEAKINEAKKKRNIPAEIKYDDIRLGKSAWEKACNETKIYLKTAEHLYKEFSKLNLQERQNIDYSCIIILLMKALELELKKIFSYEYLNYLMDVDISPQKYSELNGIAFKIIKKEWPIACKKGIYYIKKSDFDLVDDEDIDPVMIARFTLGNLNYIVGRHDEEDGRHFHNTVIDFCKNRFKLDNVVKWLTYITTSVDGIRIKRNKAAHAGGIASINDAEFCFNQMIFINKLIENVILKQD